MHNRLAAEQLGVVHFTNNTQGRLRNTICTRLHQETLYHNLTNTCLVYHRFLHLYGQENPRLDRDQNIQKRVYPKHHWLFDCGAVVCFGRPQIHQERLLKNLVDDYLVDNRDFSALISACLTEWRSSLSWVSLISSNTYPDRP